MRNRLTNALREAGLLDTTVEDDDIYHMVNVFLTPQDASRLAAILEMGN